MRERFLQFLELRRRTMHFHPSEIGNREHFREQRADVIEMRQNAFGTFVRFATENFVTVDSEPVEKDFLFQSQFSRQNTGTRL